VLLLLALQFLVPGKKLNINFIIMFGFACASKTISKITKASIQKHWQNWKMLSNKMMIKTDASH
jgi:hypothetical protein